MILIDTVLKNSCFETVIAQDTSKRVIVYVVVVLGINFVSGFTVFKQLMPKAMKEYRVRMIRVRCYTDVACIVKRFRILEIVVSAYLPVVERERKV